MTRADFYLLYTLVFDLDGQTISLYGGILATDTDVRFALGSEMPFDAHLLPAGQVTTQIVAPLGMTGVVLEELGVAGRVYRNPDGTTGVDVALEARARFTSASLSAFDLAGALVLEDGAARLAILTLTATPALTLTQFLSSVIGGASAWAASVTDQFAFQSGSMYYLRAPAGGTYTYQPSGAAALVCKAGFNVSAALRVFGVDFLIDLSVDAGTIDLVTTTAQPINVFDFITLDSPFLEISTGSAGTYLRIRTTVSVLSTPISATVEVDYSTASGGFSGSVGYGGMTVHFLWTSAGLTIQAIDGLPFSQLDLNDQFSHILNDLRSGGCQDIVSGWLNGLTTTTLKPSLAGSPTRNASGAMNVPLKLDYELSASGNTIASAQIPLTAVFSIPTSLDGLPLAIASSIVQSAESIAEGLLSNPDTYKALALEAARRYGASALARFICRALEEGLEDLARALADAAGTVVADTVAAALELAGVLIGVSLLGLSGLIAALVNFFEQIWDDIKSLFGGSSSKDEAEDKVRQVRAQVQVQIDDVDARVAAVKQQIAVSALSTSLALEGQVDVVSTIVWKTGAGSVGVQLSTWLRLLGGQPGDTAGQVLVDQPNATFPVKTPWAQIPNPDAYRMNAAAQAVLTGFQFLKDTDRSALVDAINQLNGVDDGVANDFANYLQSKLNEYDGYSQNGLPSGWVYATAAAPGYMTVGQSYIGLNTRIET